jgi:hypothetical protein
MNVAKSGFHVGVHPLKTSMARRQEWAFQPIENLSLRRISRVMRFA